MINFVTTAVKEKYPPKKR